LLLMPPKALSPRQDSPVCSVNASGSEHGFGQIRRRPELVGHLAALECQFWTSPTISTDDGAAARLTRPSLILREQQQQK
jgi:hypothetical protein